MKFLSIKDLSKDVSNKIRLKKDIARDVIELIILEIQLLKVAMRMLDQKSRKL